MKRRGMTLVVVLLIMALIVTMGMAYLGRRAPQYEGAYQASLEVQAKALAEAGIEDARVKLEKDPGFPPPGDRDQKIFSYSEEVFSAPAPGQLVGYYFVTVDTRWDDPQESPTDDFPSIITVVSTGILGDNVTNPEAAYRIKMEIEIDSNFPPTAPMRVTDWVQEGGLPGTPPPAPF